MYTLKQRKPPEIVRKLNESPVKVGLTCKEYFIVDMLELEGRYLL